MADEMENAVPGSEKTPSQFGAWPEGRVGRYRIGSSGCWRATHFTFERGLLLFGLYRVSIDFQVETTQLAFKLHVAPGL